MSELKQTGGAPQTGGEPDLTQVNRAGDTDTLNNDQVIQVTQPKFTGPAVDLNSDIPAANHNESYVEEDTPNNEQQASGQPGAQAPKASAEPFNSEFSELPEDVQQDSAALTAQAIVHGYCQSKMLIPWAITIGDKKLKKLDADGVIDMYAPVRRSRVDPTTLTVLDFVHEFNETITKPFETSQEFKETVTPILTSILKKKGIALTPEQTLMFYVAQDLMETAKNAIVAMGDRRELLDTLKEMHAGTKAAAPPAPVTPDVTPQTAAPVPGPIPTQPAAQATSATVIKDIVQNAGSKRRGPGRPPKPKQAE